MTDQNKFIADEDVVDVLYKTILARSSDENGLRCHSARIADMPRKDALQLLVPIFLESEEFKGRDSKSIVFKSFVKNLQSNNEIAINHVISLGTHCYTSYLLKMAGLKKYSCPFDWLFSSPSMVAHVINDNFCKLTDRAYFKKIPLKKIKNSGLEYSPIDHDFYRVAFSVKNVFNHHDVQLQEDYEYIIRSVERFRRVLHSDESVMFILCTRHSCEALSYFIKISESLLDKRNSAIHFRYFSIEEGSSVLPKFDILYKFSDSFELIHFKSTSKWDGLYFNNIIDDMALLNIISDGVSFNLLKY